MKVGNAQITLTISKEEERVITELFKAATDMWLNSAGIGDLVAAIYDRADSESCRTSSIVSIDVAIVYNS